MPIKKKLSKDQVEKVLSRLEALYPDAGPALEFSTPFELLVATILSAQCTDKRVNEVTSALFQQHNTPEAIASLSEEEIIGYIKTCGLFQAKSKNLKAMSMALLERFSGEVPKTREELMSLAGVGRKTANVVLSNAFGADAIAVDTHVFRVSNRIGLVSAKDVKNTEEQLMKCIPKKLWSIAHHWLIFHGRRVCHARKPDCPHCALDDVCLYALAQAPVTAKKRSSSKGALTRAP